MKIEMFADADAGAREAAAIIAAEARASVAAHGQFIVTFSGGHTPWLMLRALADETVRGLACVWHRWKNAWLPRETQTETSLICVKVCSNMPPFAPRANLRDACGIT